MKQQITEFEISQDCINQRHNTETIHITSIQETTTQWYTKDSILMHPAETQICVKKIILCTARKTRKRKLKREDGANVKSQIVHLNTWVCQ